MSRSILLIETDQPLALNMMAYLKSYEYEVDWHVDPQKAITRIDKQAPDVIVQDLILAGHSGIELLYELRSYGDLQDLPVIIYSSISIRELGNSDLTLKQLNVKSFHYKSETSLGTLVESINAVFQKVPAKSPVASV